jgi:integrase/recombinase XerD
MFRDTFAVECLLAGVPLEQLSILLGHGSIKITERHYAPWVKARQEQLTASVRKSWDVEQTTKKKVASAR